MPTFLDRRTSAAVRSLPPPAGRTSLVRSPQGWIWKEGTATLRVAITTAFMLSVLSSPAWAQPLSSDRILRTVDIGAGTRSGSTPTTMSRWCMDTGATSGTKDRPDRSGRRRMACLTPTLPFGRQRCRLYELLQLAALRRAPTERPPSAVPLRKVTVPSVATELAGLRNAPDLSECAVCESQGKQNQPDGRTGRVLLRVQRVDVFSSGLDFRQSKAGVRGCTSQQCRGFICVKDPH